MSITCWIITVGGTKGMCRPRDLCSYYALGVKTTMAHIAVVGTGYVGLVTGTIFAHLGHTVTCVENQPGKLDQLHTGRAPFYEPGLDQYVLACMQAGRLSFTSNLASGIADAAFVFITVGTPQSEAGAADLRYVEAAAREIGRVMTTPKTIVTKSTVPVGTGERVEQWVREEQVTPISFAVVSNPEFLREGSAVHDALHPDRVVVGSVSPDAATAVAELYAGLIAPVVQTDLRTSELIKYAANAFLATKISFINAFANLCDQVGADVKTLARGMGLDPRIGPSFLAAGVGYGGSCFPKDVAAIQALGEQVGYPLSLLQEVTRVNMAQRQIVVEKLSAALGGLQDKRIAVMGLAFKPDTDDIREAPALAIIPALLAAGASVQACDPVAIENAAAHLPATIEYAENPYIAARGADAVLLLTEWRQFLELDLADLAGAMRGRLILDGRNALDPVRVRQAGFSYLGMGMR